MMNRLLATSLFCSLSFGLSPVQPGLAQTSNLQKLDTESIISHLSTTHFTPSNDGVPGGTAGGGSRDFVWCSPDSPHYGVRLVPLVAMGEQNTTTEERPSFWVYIANPSLNKLLLSVKGEQGLYDYQSYVSVPDMSGVFKISLPADAPPLRVNATYEWGMAVACGEHLRPDDPFISGTIQRIVAPAIHQQSPAEQLAWYASNNVWYDTINMLAMMRTKAPEDRNLRTSWDRILEDVGLAELATAPLLILN